MGRFKKLQPCPFCGSDDVTDEGTYVQCNSCEAEGPYTGYDKDSVRLWNRRASVQQDEKGQLEATDEMVVSKMAIRQAVSDVLWGGRRWPELTAVQREQATAIARQVQGALRPARAAPEPEALRLEDIKVGDRLVLYRRVEPEAWSAGWHEDMDDYIGQSATVNTVGTPSSGVYCEFDDGEMWWLPLEAVRRPSEES